MVTLPPWGSSRKAIDGIVSCTSFADACKKIPANTNEGLPLAQGIFIDDDSGFE
jgi:hypothetical protein